MLSLVAVVYGFYHSSQNTYSYSLVCKSFQCEIKSADRGVQNLISFPKQDLLEAELIRIDDSGEYADNNRMKATPREKFGYSIRLKVRLPPDSTSRMKLEKNVIFLPYDLGRRNARTGVSKIMKFIASDNTENIDYRKGRSVTIIGVFSIFFGLISAGLAFFLGRWSEQKRLKKAS